MSGFFQIFLDLVVDKMVVNLYITDNAVIQGHFQAAPQKPEIYLVYVDQLVHVIGELAL